MSENVRVIISLLASGFTVDEIQKELSISPPELNQALKTIRDLGYNYAKSFSSDGTITIKASRKLNLNPKEHITVIKGYSWLADDKSMLYLNIDESYTWYQKDEDHKDNYYEGHYKTYKGEEAINYISSNLKEYGLTDEEQRKIFEDKKIDIDNYYLIIITCEKMIQNGKEETVANNIAYYYGLYTDETKRLELTNLSSKLKIGLTLKEKISNIDI